MKVYNLLTITLTSLSLLSCVCFADKEAKLSNQAISVPISGNTYITQIGDASDQVSQKGIAQWSNTKSVISTFFKVSQKGAVNLFIKAKTEQEAVIKVSVGTHVFDVKLKNQTWDTIPVGAIEIDEIGYVQVNIQGVSKRGTQFAEIADLIIDGDAAIEPLAFVRGFEPYWGRRGPSVHLKYTLPKDKEVKTFYNEVTVPVGKDVLGSYYMANGFGEGYFGMQANSETERRILFSVWSPFDTQDPKSIPADEQIKMLRRGKDVHIGEFGNEGSGGQSYLKYPWVAGNSYKFLSQVEPDVKGNTIYTAYFYAPEEGAWRLIASFLRPKTNTWYTNAHSFLENFIPEQGYITRMVMFGNQWVCTNKGEWIELTESMFTNDATAQAGVRMDYAGGLAGEGFYLQNCGFFNESTPYKSMFTRNAKSIAPVVDFSALAKIKSVK